MSWTVETEILVRIIDVVFGISVGMLLMALRIYFRAGRGKIIGRVCPHCSRKLSKIRWVASIDCKGNPVDVLVDLACIPCSSLFPEEDLPSKYEILE